MNRKYGYARISSRDQNEHRQLRALYSADVPDENVFVDKQSGKDFDRPMYQIMVEKMRENDVLFVESIDRLGRNYEEIISQWNYLTREKKIDIVIIDMPLLDTRQGKDLLGTFISDLVLQILSFVAENERKQIRQRQKEGIAAAKARGVRFGRPQCPVPNNFYCVSAKWLRKELSITEAASMCSMPVSTFRNKALKRHDFEHRD